MNEQERINLMAAAYRIISNVSTKNTLKKRVDEVVRNAVGKVFGINKDEEGEA